MNTAVMPKHKPFFDINVEWYKRINWGWWSIRTPMVLLAVPSAWGVGAFAYFYGDLPLPVSVVAGAAFETAYIGAIALADQQHDDKDDLTNTLWWLVNLFAVMASILSNALFFSGGTYRAITAEVLTHAIPLPVLGFAYGLLLHRMSAKAARKIMDNQEEMELRAKHRCRYCDAVDPNHRGFISDAAVRGHLANCPNKPKN